MRIREYPPLRLVGEVEVPGSLYGRWGQDAHDPEMIASGLSFSTTMPGGFEQATVNLPRNVRRTFRDLNEFATVRFRGVGGSVAFEGRIQASPSVAGDQMAVNPEITGWNAHLDDYTACREIYLDPDFNNWQPASLQLKINDNPSWDYDDASVAPDATTGNPALVTSMTGSWARNHVAKACYDARGIPLGPLYYAWSRLPTVDPANTNWAWSAYLADDDVQTGSEGAMALRAAGPAQGVFTPTYGTHKFAFVQLTFAAALSGWDGFAFAINWSYLGVTGRSGIPILGTFGQTGGIGVLASDVILDALKRWAPKIGFTTGSGGSVQGSSFLIPNCAFTDPVTVSAIIQEVTKYELLDWAVWEGPTFYMNGWGGRGRHWQARIREAQLEDAGPQVDRTYNAVVVTFNDATGIARAAGPTGTNLQFQSDALKDLDPTNLATQAGILRYSPPLALGTSDPVRAIQAGQRYLQELKAINTSGQAQLSGYVEDAMTGVVWPAWMVRAGDWISFVDASNTAYRRIIRTSYDDGQKINQISLDAPPDDMQALLERMNALITLAGG